PPARGGWIPPACRAAASSPGRSPAARAPSPCSRRAAGPDRGPQYLRLPGRLYSVQMDAAISDPMSQDRQIAAVVQRERGRLLAFIRRRIDDASEAEDILQDVLY